MAMRCAVKLIVFAAIVANVSCLLPTAIMRQNILSSHSSQPSWQNVHTLHGFCRYSRISARMAEKSVNSTPAKSLEVLMEEAKEYETDAVSCLNSAGSSQEIETFRVAFLGKNGKLSGMMKEMRSLAKEDKPKLGEVVNKAVKVVEEAIETAKVNVKDKEYKEILEQESIGNTFQISGIPAFHKASGSRHPINLVMDLTSKIFEDIGYEIITGAESSPEIENDFYNFEALGMPFSHSARDMQDTLYINSTHTGKDDTLLLRTHTSAVQIREMEKRDPPFKICAPGRVYRKDDVDATHFPVFHQVEILAVDEIGKLTVPHLLGTVKHFLRRMFGDDIEVKYRASYFPFTEPSMEVDVFFKGKWLEVLGCGMVDPVVLEAVGIDPEKYGGFAAGFGVERFAMIMHNIQDIRLFWENDSEFLTQFPSTQYGIPGEDDEARARDAAMDDTPAPYVV
mmetsp:Transcript_21057/g.35665  ORF Transcript_21057/g.35665 Transcript_21057/m.35665 type:complete len:452 (-) Transcript_21057:172-1527(-)